MYLALYRKYRPKNFDSVIGQEAILKTLKNSIIHNKINHAYLFCGPRGTGKTSIAKIFARSVNCTDSKDGNPCDQCDSCNVSRETSAVDIIEIDAASNNGVDEIRELRNNVNIVPSSLKYKVYIIDEVHMLSTSAFNALLKTLEEPPKHVIFILATTDPQKLPETIISRCQTFNFQRISSNLIVDYLKQICSYEKIELDDEILKEISIIVDGGLRDSLGILDKLASYSNEKISLDDFYLINGMISKKDLNNLMNSIFIFDNTKVLTLINEFNTCGKNIIQISMQLLHLIKDYLVDYYIESENLDYSIDLYISLANLLNEKMTNIKMSSDPKIYVEILLLNWINSNNISQEFKLNISNESEKIHKLSVDKSVSAKNNVSSVYVNKEMLTPKSNFVSEKNSSIMPNEPKQSLDIINISNIKDIMEIRVNNVFCEVDKNEVNKIRNKIKELNSYVFDQQIGYIASELLNAKIQAASKKTIVISYEYDSVVDNNLANIDVITDTYNKIFNENKTFAIISDNNWNRYKNEFISNSKNNVKYELLDEPELIVEKNIENNNVKSNENDGFFGLFNDIVEVE